MGGVNKPRVGCWILMPARRVFHCFATFIWVFFISRTICCVTPSSSTAITRYCAERTNSLPFGKISFEPVRWACRISGLFLSNSPRNPPPLSRSWNSRYFISYAHGIIFRPSSPSHSCWVTLLNMSPADAPLINFGSVFTSCGDKAWQIRRNGICISSEDMVSMP